MRRFAIAALAILLVASPITQARGAPMGDGTRPITTSSKAINLSGKVSDDGKVLTADDENDWRVTNADLMRGLEGRYVVVKCRMDVIKRAIRVLSVEEPSETKNTRHLGDAAFRR
jgi:hypothetical protein